MSTDSANSGVRLSTSTVQTTGRIDARVVVRQLPIADVRRLLPGGLEPAPNPVSFPDKHPVFFMFSTNGLETPVGNMDFDEVRVGVPYVQLADARASNRGPFIFVPRVFLNARLAVTAGKHMYGIETEFATLTTDASTASVRRKEAQILQATFVEAGAELPPSEVPNFEAIRQLLEQPTISMERGIVGQATAYGARWSPFVCTCFGYDFADDRATIQPLTAVLETTEALLPTAIPAGRAECPSLMTHELGAFRFAANQAVSRPVSCEDTVYQRAAPPRRQRVVVIGSGPSSCAAAFYLAKQRERYEVHLYTPGWRMGGKCAAGRNADAANRIEEHGLHAFIGFYENAFRTLREVYEVANLDLEIGEAPHDLEGGEGPFAKAFHTASPLGVMATWEDQWRFFPTPNDKPNARMPGQIPLGGESPMPTFADVFTHALNRVDNGVSTLLAHDDKGEVEARFRVEGASTWTTLASELRGVVDLDISSARRSLSALVGHIEKLALNGVVDGLASGSLVFKGLALLLRLIRRTLKVVLGEKIENDPDVWFVWSGLDVVMTVAIGVIDDRAANFDVLDDYDMREWLLGHGLDPRNAQYEGINQVYETLFAHGPEEPTADLLACGVGLRWFILLSFLYRGHMAYKFNYSCPQTMLTPYYLALQNLGATVHFFHRTEEVTVSGTGDDRHLQSIRMKVQATIKDGATYDPFVRIAGNPAALPAWPNKPNHVQLVEGEELVRRDINLENVWSNWEGAGELVLEQGRDFDLCVLGTPVSVLPKILSDVTEPSAPGHVPEWKQMLESTKVIRTNSAQLWFRAPHEQLKSNEIGLMTCFAGPEPSFGDFSKLLQWESWGDGPNRAQSLSYHTGAGVSITSTEAYPESEPDPEQKQAEWRETFATWLEANFAGLYDKVDSYEVLLEMLATQSPDATGPTRLDEQFFVTSIQPSDHYTLSQPGTMRQRLRQDGSWVKHLFLCGDWTQTDMNCGCVEAATQSGMLASRAISNLPRYIWRVGF